MLRKKAPKKSKSSVKQTLQTFFSDLFPSSTLQKPSHHEVSDCHIPFSFNPRFIFSGKIFGQMEGKPEIEMISDRLRLSYVDPSRCIELLKLYGVRVATGASPIDRSQLPVVVALPETKFHETVPDHEKTFPH